MEQQEAEENEAEERGRDRELGWLSEFKSIISTLYGRWRDWVPADRSAPRRRHWCTKMNKDGKRLHSSAGPGFWNT